MKIFHLLLVITLFVSCYGGQKLIQRPTPDGGKILVKKEFFSGIDYLYVEKRLKGKIKYKLIYDCECGVFDINLRKEYFDENGISTAWQAVTDTSGLSKNEAAFFGIIQSAPRVVVPIQFMAITTEEIDVIQEGLIQVTQTCCKNPDKPVSKIIGFVKLQLPQR